MDSHRICALLTGSLLSGSLLTGSLVAGSPVSARATASASPAAGGAGQARQPSDQPGQAVSRRLAAGRQAPVDSPVRRWRAPVGPPLRVVSTYRPPARRWQPGHRGVDLRTTPEQQVRAAGAGRVVHAGNLAGRPVVSIDHGELRTTYEPVAPEVNVGQRVAAGEPIGTIATGTGHCGDGRCLHFGVRRGREYVNPMFLLAGYQAVLRPW